MLEVCFNLFSEFEKYISFPEGGYLVFPSEFSRTGGRAFSYSLCLRKRLFTEQRCGMKTVEVLVSLEESVLRILIIRSEVFTTVNLELYTN